jgi:hypothetical protein
VLHSCSIFKAEEGSQTSFNGAGRAKFDVSVANWPLSIALSIWFLSDAPACVMQYAMTCGFQSLNKSLRSLLESQDSSPGDPKVLQDLRNLRTQYVRLCFTTKELTENASPYIYTTCFGGCTALVVNEFLILAAGNELIAATGYVQVTFLMSCAAVFVARLVIICIVYSMPPAAVSDFCTMAFICS